MFEALLKLIARALDSYRIPYMLVGGQAVLLYGEARLTADVDITIGVGPGDFPVVLNAAKEAGLQARIPSPADFVKQNLVLPCEQLSSSKIRVDLIFSLSHFERQAIERARVVTVGETPVRYATPEDLTILKVLAGRPRDLEDVRSILLKQRQVDFAYVRRWLRELQAGLDQDLIGTFERLLKATRSPETK